MPRAEDFLPTAQAFEVDHLLNEDVHIVPRPSPSKPPGQAYAGVCYADLSSFPSVADPPGAFAAEAGTTTQTVIGAGHRVGVPLASLLALDAWFHPIDERIARAYSAGDLGVALCRRLTDNGCRIMTTWLCVQVGTNICSDAAQLPAGSFPAGADHGQVLTS